MFEPGKLKELVGDLPVAKKVAPDPFTLESLIAWLRTKDADEVYCYTDHGRCLIGQYFTENGIRFHAIWSNGWDSVEDGLDSPPQHQLPLHWDKIALGHPYDLFRTFGAALARAEKLLASGRTPLPSNEAKRSGSL